MQVQPVTFDPKEARTLWRRYRLRALEGTEIDGETAAVYKAIAQGKTIIRAIDSIVKAGVHSEGRYEGMPKLAICRADARQVVWHSWNQGGEFLAEDGGYRYKRAARHRVTITSGMWPGMTSSHPDGKARLPTIPLPLRPKHGLGGLHILWEAEWKPLPPEDPILLRRIGKSDAWIVIAQWDLTPVEQAVMATRMGS